MALLRFSSRFVKNAKNSNNKIKVITATTTTTTKQSNKQQQGQYSTEQDSEFTHYIYITRAGRKRE